MHELLTGFYNTAPLWINEQFSLSQFEFPTVSVNSVDPVDLPVNLRLGHQMEYVFSHLISSSKSFEIVYQNLLIEEGKTRVGELDFIVKHVANNKYLHVELAYKFYIVNPEISEPIYRLMGPNKRDMFYTKLDKLKEKQLPLLHHKSLMPYWQTIAMDPLEFEQQCCFKAQLFMPYGEKVSIRPLNTACISGSWIRFDDFNSEEFKQSHYYIPRKQEWVISPHEKVNWMTHYETLMEINLRMVKANAPMLWVKRKDGQFEKLFVVWW